MSTTHGSSFEYQSGLEWSVPSRWQPQLFSDLTELQAYRAAQPYPGELERLRAEVQRLQAMVPNPAKARHDRTQSIEDLVLLALDNARLREDMMELTYSFRTQKVIDHLNYYKEDHGDVKRRYDIKKAPSRAKVRAILRAHGYLL